MMLKPREQSDKVSRREIIISELGAMHATCRREPLFRVYFVFKDSILQTSG